MGQYFLVDTLTNKEYELKVTTGDSLGSENSIVIYESAGGDGGTAINLGRLNKSRTLTCKLLSGLINSQTKKYSTSEVLQRLSNIIAQLTDLKDRGIPISLKAPITDNTTGSYLIKSFNADVATGNASYVNATIVLVEDRQLNVKSSIVNIIGGEVLKQMRTVQQRNSI